METVTSMDLQTWCNLLISSYESIKANYQGLNKINVFPVADGDTGTNMLYTMSKIVECIKESSQQTDLYTLNSKLRSVALIESRGNSGTVLAQILIGLCNSDPKENQMGLNRLQVNFNNANKNAQESFSNPEKGTILDIIKTAAESILSTKKVDLRNIFQDMHAACLISLENTKGILPKNSEAGVVDAGAAGLVMIIEGFIKGLNGNTDYVDLHVEQMKAGQKQKADFDYCIEVVLEGLKIDISDFRKTLATLGNSIQIVNQENLHKVHIHSDYPAEIKNYISRTAIIQSFKSDSLNKINTPTKVDIPRNTQNKSLAILVDTSADLPERQDTLHNIYYATIPIFLDYDDKFSLEDYSHDDFYRQMKENNFFTPKTSKVSTGNYIEWFQKLLKDYDEVVCLTLSSGISGSYESALLAKKSLTDIASRIHIFDTKTSSAGIGYYVDRVLEAWHNNLNLNNFLNALEPAKPKTLFMVDDTKYLIRGGRLTGVKSIFAKLFKVQPVLKLDKEGKIVPTKQQSFFKNYLTNLEYIYNELMSDLQSGEPIQTINIVTSDDLATKYVNILTENIEENPEFKQRNLEITKLKLTLVVGAHTGPGTFGLIYY